jgi:ABC-type sugar transport system ATPase subunit
MSERTTADAPRGSGDTSASDPAIELIEVSKNYGSVAAVQHLTLSIAEGEFVVLLGPSGCGKSTLLKMIAGLEEVTAGEVYIGGRLANYLRPGQRDVAMVFQNYALYPHMTVRKNLGFPLRMRGKPRREVASRVAFAATLLDLEKELDRYPDELSGGQRQRVALGRAIVREPLAFLMDEPLSNLDALLRVQMRTELLRLHRRVGRTTIYVTHDQVEAMTMADRIVVMRAGVVQQVGHPDEVYNEPANTYVATFVGSRSMNLFSGRIATTSGARYFEGAFAVALSEERSPAIADGDVVLGVRPEDVTLCSDATNGNVSGIVDLAERVGSSVYLDIRLASGDTIVAAVDASNQVREGESVVLELAPNKLSFFAPSGDRLNTEREPA